MVDTLYQLTPQPPLFEKRGVAPKGAGVSYICIKQQVT